MAEFSELRISNASPFTSSKWNGLVDRLKLEVPANLSDQKLELSSSESNSKLHLEATKGFSLIESKGAKPLAINLNRAKVGIGTSIPMGALHIINANQNANGNTLILGPINQANLRLGYHSSYSWIQAHGRKPLTLNPAGNNVGIGTTAPAARLHVKGTLRADAYTYNRSSDRLIIIQRFKNITGNVSKNTNYNTTDWNAAIVGFQAADGDINENHSGRIMVAQMLRKSSRWHIFADFRSHNKHEKWTVDVMFVRKEISKRIGI